MKTKPLFLILVSVLASILLLTSGYALAMNGSRAQSSPQAVAGSGITYQGYLEDGGMPANGLYDFSFELFDAETEGTSILTTTNEDVEVVDGLFAVLLDFDSSAFNGDDRWLEISVRPGGETVPYTPLEGRQQITATPYALYAVEADTVDGLHASELGNHYQNMVVVAKSGGDYSSVQAAIDSITDAAVDHPYMVWVAPGVYSETVTMRPYVHLQGAGQEATVITSTASNSTHPFSQATIVLADHTSLRDLTVSNHGMDTNSISLLATGSTTETRLINVTVQAMGSGVNNFAIWLDGSGTGIILEQVTALAENGSEINVGLQNFDGATAILRGGSFTGHGGGSAYGVRNESNINTSTMIVEGTSIKAENASDSNRGFYNDDGDATLRGGYFTGRGGEYAYGIQNSGNGAVLEADKVTVLGEYGSDGNSGLWNTDLASATLYNSSFTGRGGSFATGIYFYGESTLIANGVNALAENASSNNKGLVLSLSDSVTLIGGSYIGQGGADAYGITHFGNTFSAQFITASGQNGSNSNYGFYHTDSFSNDIQQSILSGTTNAIKSEYGYFTVSNSRLVGGPVSTINGAVTCVLVTRGTIISMDGSTCP